MEILIEKNIRRLRNIKMITQEQLSEALGVTCAAVSKWERGETYPDITLLFPLAHYFDITLDELMGYNKEQIEKEIENILNEYKKLYRSDYKKSRELITEAYRKYPNNYKIMNCYMWNLGGDYADTRSGCFSVGDSIWVVLIFVVRYAFSVHKIYKKNPRCQI